MFRAFQTIQRAYFSTFSSHAEANLKILGLSVAQLSGLSEAEAAARIREAYLPLAKKYHPDMHRDPAAARIAGEHMKNLNAARGNLLTAETLRLLIASAGASAGNGRYDAQDFSHWRRAAEQEMRSAAWREAQEKMRREAQEQQAKMRAQEEARIREQEKARMREQEEARRRRSAESFLQMLAAVVAKRQDWASPLSSTISHKPPYLEPIELTTYETPEYLYMVEASNFGRRHWTSHQVLSDAECAEIVKSYYEKILQKFDVLLQDLLSDQRRDELLEYIWQCCVPGFERNRIRFQFSVKNRNDILNIAPQVKSKQHIRVLMNEILCFSAISEVQDVSVTGDMTLRLAESNEFFAEFVRSRFCVFCDCDPRRVGVVRLQPSGDYGIKIFRYPVEYSKFDVFGIKDNKFFDLSNETLLDTCPFSPLPEVEDINRVIGESLISKVEPSTILNAAFVLNIVHGQDKEKVEAVIRDRFFLHAGHNLPSLVRDVSIKGFAMFVPIKLLDFFLLSLQIELGQYVLPGLSDASGPSQNKHTAFASQLFLRRKSLDFSKCFHIQSQLNQLLGGKFVKSVQPDLLTRGGLYIAFCDHADPEKIEHLINQKILSGSLKKIKIEDRLLLCTIIPPELVPYFTRLITRETNTHSFGRR